MKLVHDADNLVELDIGNLSDIPLMARRFAGQCETGEFGEVTRALVIVQNEDGLQACLWGENASGYEKMGMLSTLQMMIYEDDQGE